jgi:GNAT superfamily N-acetyltransferase
MPTQIEITAPTVTDRPRPDGADIRKVTRADLAVVARALAESFFDDPHFAWIVRDRERRLAKLERAFTTFCARVWLPHDHGYTNSQRSGAAMWLPPGEWHLSAWAQLKLAPAVIRDLGFDAGRLLRALAFIERKHPREPHWYLPAIGVAPAWQGRGYGAALLRPILERCDRERLPAYLEASTKRNRSLYQRHGFETIEECRYADNAPLLWRMWREPRG